MTNANLFHEDESAQQISPTKEQIFIVRWHWIFAFTEPHRRVVTMTLPQAMLMSKALKDLSDELGIDQISINQTDDPSTAMPLHAFLDELETFIVREEWGRDVSLGEILRNACG